MTTEIKAVGIRCFAALARADGFCASLRSGARGEHVEEVESQHSVSIALLCHAERLRLSGREEGGAEASLQCFLCHAASGRFKHGLPRKFNMLNMTAAGELLIRSNPQKIGRSFLPAEARQIPDLRRDFADVG